MSEAAQGTNRCKHAGCKCTVRPGEEFCSEHCKQAGTQGAQGTGTGVSPEACHCGHADCH